MAFITYRVSTTPPLATANVAKGLQLTNSEIDANFKALDDGKLEKNGSAASLTGLPLTTGVTDILPVANGGTGSSTASTGSGGVVLATSPTLVTPSLGIPSFLDLTNARNLPLDGTIAVSGKLPIAFGGTNSTATPTAGTIPYGTGTAYAFTAAGTTGQVLTSAGTGTPTWATITTSAGGSNTQLQYNSSGSFAGSANMTFNGTTLALNSLSVTNGAVIQGLTVGVGTGAVATNTAVGVSVLQANTTGSGNTAIGYQALYSNTGGIGNIASGRQALYSTTTGNNNTASGYQTLYSNLTGSNNIAIGVSALYSNTAWNNIAIGTGAGTNLTTGGNNIIIGSVPGTAGLSDTVIIAAGSTERLRIDSTGKMIAKGQVETPDVTSLLTTANTYPTTRPSLNLDFANSATLDPRITFTRGTNATYIGSDGLVKTTAGVNSPRFDWDPVTRECKGLLIEEARTNLFTYSNNMSNSGWTRAAYSGGTYTDNQLSPDGSTSGLLVTGLYNTNLGSIATDIVSNTLSVIAGQTITFSVYAKLATANTAPLILRIKTNGSGTSFTSSTTLSVDTWTRCVLTCTVPTGDTSCDVVIGASSTPLNVIVWGAQLELGAFATSYIPSSVTWTGRASTATYVGSNGLIQTAASGVARYQYNPTNLSVAPFLLLEPAATNLVTYSDDTSNYSYLQDVSITVNQITSPDGSITADKITSTLTGGANTCIVQKQNTIAADTQTYTYSIFVKAGTSPTTTLNLQLAGGTYQQVVGIITWSTNTISTGTLVNYGNGWFKASITLTNNGTNTIIIPRIYVRDQGTANVSGEYEYIWGWQVETGSVATSYIPTTTATVTRIADTSTSAQTTRSADVATMTNSNFSSWYNQTEGTFVLKADIIQRSSSTSYPRMIAAVGADYNNEEIGIYMVTTGTFAGLPNSTVTSAGVQTFGFVVVVPTLYAWTASIAYKANDSYFMAAGLTGNVTDTSVTLPICTELRIFGAVRYQPMSSGHIAKLTYYPTRLSNSTLQALTT